MTRNSTIHPVSIGNGLFAQIRRPETIGEAYRRIRCHLSPGGRSSVVEVTIHFGRADARLETAHIGAVHWVNLWAIQNSPTNGVRIFCPTPEAAEVLTEAFIKCGARRVNRQVDAANDF